MSVRSEIIAQLHQVAREYKRPVLSLTDETPLLQTGLDSLSLAVLAVRLEDVLGVDPFSSSKASEFPVTLGDFVAFYENAVSRCRMELSHSAGSDD